MNERIKELSQEAFAHAVIHGRDYKPPTDFDMVYERKFAELIVQECIDVVVDVLPDIVPESKDGFHPAWHLKEHFGVEE
jgi:hypothetical protein